MKKSIALLVASLTVGAAAASAMPIYETGFEPAGEDPSGAEFNPGPLSGQGANADFEGWQVLEEEVPGSTQVVDESVQQPQAGSQSVLQGANSTISARKPSSAQRVLIRAWHRGAGIADLVAPAAGTQAAAVIAFESTGDSQYTVRAWDGNSGGFAPAAATPPLTTESWNEIILSVNYGTRQFDVAVNDNPMYRAMGFFDPSLASFSGFQSTSRTGAGIDTVGFFESTGDADGDDWDDDREMRLAGGNALDAAKKPGDVNGDGLVNMVDALLQARIGASAITANGLNSVDVNLNGVTGGDTEDGFQLFTYAAGQPLPPLQDP